jgi:hypothetical protein
MSKYRNPSRLGESMFISHFVRPNFSPYLCNLILALGLRTEGVLIPVLFCFSVVSGLDALTNQQGLLSSLPPGFPTTPFFNVAPALGLSSSHHYHVAIFIASTQKLQLQIALGLLYPATPLKTSNNPATPLTAPGYVSISTCVCTSRAIAFSPHLHLLP